MSRLDLKIIDDKFFEYIEAHRHSDIFKILMGKDFGDNEVMRNFAATQIEIRKRGLRKFYPLLDEKSKFLFADKTAYEQASNALVAAYNASLIPQGCTLADLTAGTGIDTISFAGSAKEVFSIEKENFRAEILTKNISLLGLNNITVVNANSTTWLETQERHFDVIYIDPARRDSSGNRKYLLSDCSPDLNQHLNLFKSKCNRLLVKVSPLLDIKETFRNFPNISAFHIIDYKNECKEIVLDFDFANAEGSSSPKILCVEILDVDRVEKTDFEYQEENVKITGYLSGSEALRESGYIYLPSAAVMKSGCHAQLKERFPELEKLSANSHLYFSGSRFQDFPGRCFRIERLVGSKDLKALKGVNLNVISRNYPVSSADISKKYRLRAEGCRYLLATKVREEKVCILAEEIKD